MSDSGLLITGILVFAFALLARALRGSPLTAPMLFLGIGWLLATTGLIQPAGSETALHLIAEATLVIVLFSDAAMTDLSALRRDHTWPVRMLVVGLPVAIVLGTLGALLMLTGFSIYEAALVAAILAPTDAALGQSVVTNSAVPERVRRALVVESGLNDGFALPLVVFFGCLAVGGVHDGVQIGLIPFISQQLGIGVLSGILVGALGGWLLKEADRRGLSDPAYEGIAVLALAGLAYLGTVALGGNGFVAAFVAGLAFGAILKRRCKFVFEFIETEGQALILITFLLLGAALLPNAISNAEPQWLLLIFVSLFVVRPLAIWISLMGTETSPLTRLFLGWFGPRGLATALFALFAAHEFETLPHGAEIISLAVLTVFVSAVLHGVTSASGARWYGRKICSELHAAEMKPVASSARPIAGRAE